MLQSARVTAFTVFVLLRENQHGGGGGVKLPPSPPPPPTQIRVKHQFHKMVKHTCLSAFEYSVGLELKGFRKNPSIFWAKI